MERSYTCKVVTIVTLFGLASSYISKAAPFYPQQSTFKTTKSTTSLFVKSDVPVAQTIETSNVQKQSEASLVPTNALDSSTSSVSSELNALLNKMPLTEKYSILIESYSKELSQSFPKKSENFQLIESLYSEMVEKAVVPTEKSTFSFLNAASLFCNSVQLGQSIQLIKSGKVDDGDDELYTCTSYGPSCLYCISGGTEVFRVIRRSTHDAAHFRCRVNACNWDESAV